MAWNGVGMFTEVEGNVDVKQYVEFMDQHLPQSMKDLGIPLEKAIFQQDSGPKHISKLAQTWFSFTFPIPGIFSPQLTYLGL